MGIVILGKAQVVLRAFSHLAIDGHRRLHLARFGSKLNDVQNAAYNRQVTANLLLQVRYPPKSPILVILARQLSHRYKYVHWRNDKAFGQDSVHGRNDACIVFIFTLLGPQPTLSLGSRGNALFTNFDFTPSNTRGPLY
jgi:hypothetical protein